MRDPKDLARELTKVLDTVVRASNYFHHNSTMNAELHLSGTVRHTPLGAAVTGAEADLRRLIEEIDPTAVEAIPF